MPKGSALKLLLGALITSQLINCIGYEPAVLVPTVPLSSEDVFPFDKRTQNLRFDLGLEVGLNETDSLLNIEVLPGVRVRDVSTNGPADSAGIQVGDVILAIGNVATNHPDALEALQQTSGNGNFEFRVQRNTTVFVTTVTGRPINSSNGPEELYRVDPIATRAGYSTEVLSINNEIVAAARVEEIFPNSPLPIVNIGYGDLIIRLNGRNLNSAQDLVTRIIQEHELGEEIVMTIYNGDDILEKTVRLWDPGRRISRIKAGPFLQYESSLSPSSETFSILDFWLFSLYSYSRIEGERSHNIFSLFNITSDYGTLTEIEN